MARIGASVAYSELYGRATVSAILRESGRFSLPETLRLLSKLGYVLCRADDDDPDQRDAERQAIEYMFSHETRARMRALAQRKGEIQPLARQQILVAMKLIALAHADKGGMDPAEEQARHLLGDLLLKVTDLFHACQFPDGSGLSRDLIDQPSATMRGFAASMALESEPDEVAYGGAMVRYWKILNELVPAALVGLKLPRDRWDAAFREIHRCDLRDVALLSLLIHLQFWSQRRDGYRGGHLWFEPSSFLRSLTWDRDRTDAVLQHLTIGCDDLALRFLVRQSLPFTTDFTVFREKPLVADGPGFQILDLQCLRGMFGDQLLRQVRAAIPVRQQQSEYGNVLGTAFQAYVRWLLHEGFPPDNVRGDRLVELPAGRQKAPDFEITNGSVTTLIEVKGMLFSDHAVYSNDPQLFAMELYRNYADDKGLAQLTSHISRMCCRPETERPRRVQPVLVGLDGNLSTLGVPCTLRTHFSRHLEEAWAEADPSTRPIVSPLVVLPVEDLERILGFATHGCPIKDILDETVVADPQGDLPMSDLIRRSRYARPALPAFISDALDEVESAAKAALEPQGNGGQTGDGC